MIEHEQPSERDIRRLPEFWTPGTDSEQLVEGEDTFAGRKDWDYSTYNQEKQTHNVGPAGDATFIHGEFTSTERPRFEVDPKTGKPIIDPETKRPKLIKDPETGKPEMGPDPNFGKTYERWTFPGDLHLKHPELGNLDLTKVRVGKDHEKDKGASFWGDAEFIELPSNISTVSEQQLQELKPVEKKPFVNKQGKGTSQTFELEGRTVVMESYEDGRVNIYENRNLDTSKEQTLDLQLPRMDLAVGAETRPLDTYHVKIRRVEMDVQTTPFAGNKVRGRAKFEVAVTPSTE